MSKETRAREILDIIELADKLKKLKADNSLSEVFKEAEQIIDVDSTIFELYKCALYMSHTQGEMMHEVSKMREDIEREVREEFLPSGNA